LFKTYSDQDDIDAVSSIIKRGTYWAIGPEIEQFESQIAKYAGSKYALAFNSGTSALHALLLAYGIKGCQIIVPTFTFIATANAVVLAGGKPVFAESEDETYGLDASDVKERITGDTKAILMMHYGGSPARDIEKLRKIADSNNLLLIEDAAQAFASLIGPKNAGTFGDSAIYSFCQNKLISTGEGGAIVTDSQEIFEKAKLLRSHGRVEEANDYFSHTGDNDYIEAGYNLRMPTMLAALGMSQLKKVDKLIRMRREIAQYFDERLSGISKIKTPEKISGHRQVYQMYTIKLSDNKTRDGLQKHLEKKGVMTKVYFNPVHLKTIYMRNYGYGIGDLPKTEDLSTKVLTLPMYPGLKEGERAYIVDSIKEFFG